MWKKIPTTIKVFADTTALSVGHLPAPGSVMALAGAQSRYDIVQENPIAITQSRHNTVPKIQNWLLFNGYDSALQWGVMSLDSIYPHFLTATSTLSIIDDKMTHPDRGPISYTHRKKIM